MYTIDGDKLADAIRLYNETTGDPATDEMVRDTILLYDWNCDPDEHQQWLNTATAQEISDWLAQMVFSE